MTQETIRQTLTDAGCPQETITAFLESSGAESLRVLRQHRCTLLEILHEEQKKLDCLDYLLYQLKKESL